MMNRLVPLALFIVVLSSGCTVPILGIELPIPGFGGQVVQYEHDVIVIKSLEAIPNEIDSGQISEIVAYIENVGPKAVVDPIEVVLYDYCEGLYTPKVVTCPKGGAVLNRQGDTICVISGMLPGEIVPVIWSVCQNRADPLKVKTVCPPDGMKVLVRYPYTTTSVTTLSLISLSELQRQMIERTYTPTDSYIALGPGPIKPYLTVEDQQPVPVFNIAPGIDIPHPEGGTAFGTDEDVINARTVLKLQLKNMGSGQLDTKVGDEIGIPGSDVVVTGIGSGTDLVPVTPGSLQANKEPITCIFASGGGGNWENEVLRFVGKETSPYFCQIALSQLAGKVSLETTRHIEAQVKYDYIVTKNVLLTVNPKIVG